MAQVVEHGAVFIAHAVRKIGISEAAVTRGLRHILQDAQLLLNRLLTLPRELAPLRQYVVLDVIALLRSQVTPGVFFLAKIRTLLRVHAIPLVELVADAILLLGREILKRPTALELPLALLRGHVAHLVDERPR